MDNAVRCVPRSAWRWLLVLIACQMLMSIFYMVVVPPLEKEDEYIHWDYIRYLRTTGLPNQYDPYVRENAGEFHQPPLFYLSAALVTLPIPLDEPSIRETPSNPFGLSFHLQATPDNANAFMHNPANLVFPWDGDHLSLRLVRLLGILYGAGALAALFWTAWLIFENQWWALGTAAWLGLRPSVADLNARVSNDPMTLLAGTLVMMVAVWIVVRGITWKRVLLLGGLVGLMILVKFTSASTVLAIPLAFVLAPGFTEQWRKRIGQFAAAVGAGLAVAGWWFIRNFVLYGDFTGMSLGEGADRPGFVQVRQTAPDFADFQYHAAKAFREYWALFTVRGMPPWANVILVVLAILLVAGLILLVTRRRYRTLVKQPRAGIYVLVIAGLYSLQLAVMYIIVTNGFKARFVYAGWSAMALGMQLGWLGLLDTFRSKGATRPGWNLYIPAGLLIALNLYAGLAIVKPSYDIPRRVQDPAQLADRYSVPVDIQFGDTIRLIGYEIEPVKEPGSNGWATLCWQSLGPTDIPYAYALHIVNADAFKAVERNTYPGLGMYPTVYWEPDVAFCDRVRIELDANAPVPEAYNVTLRFFDPDTLEGLTAQIDGQPVGEEVTIGQMAIVPKRWPESGAVQYLLGENLAITDLGLLDNSVDPGEAVQVQVEWLAQEAIDVDYTAFVHVFGPEGEFITQADQQPLAGRFPTRVWTQGVVLRDTIAVPLPAEAAPGSYRIVFGMYRSDTTERLPLTTPDGTPQTDNLVTIGTVDVR